MQTVNSTTNYVNLICFPWKPEKKCYKKVAAWAAFFLFAWIYHPLTAIHRCYKKLAACGKTHAVAKKVIMKNPISETLSGFNNLNIKNQINGIYITTNETNLEATRKLFENQPRPINEIQTIHIGCATWHNLDIICARKTSYGLIVDFNPKNADFINKTIELIDKSENRHAFKEHMNTYLNSLEGKQKDLFFHWDQKGKPTERIENELSREGSWLQSDENFLFIKKQVSNMRLIAITEDITNYVKFAQIRKFLDKHNIIIDTLYLSNICNFMRTISEKDEFVKSIKLLLNNDTILINCPKLKNSNSETIILQQQSTLGKEILAKSFDSSKLFEDIILKSN